MCTQEDYDMKKTIVNHEAVLAKAVSSPEEVMDLVEHMKRVRLFIDKHKIDAFDDDVIVEFLSDNSTAKLGYESGFIMLGNCVTRLAVCARAVDDIVPNVTKMSNVTLVAELMRYLYITDSDVQQSEFERDMRKRAAAQ
jgi:hypothetical protein